MFCAGSTHLCALPQLFDSIIIMEDCQDSILGRIRADLARLLSVEPRSWTLPPNRGLHCGLQCKSVTSITDDDAMARTIFASTFIDLSMLAICITAVAYRIVTTPQCHLAITLQHDPAFTPQDSTISQYRKAVSAACRMSVCKHKGKSITCNKYFIDGSNGGDIDHDKFFSCNFLSLHQRAK